MTSEDQPQQLLSYEKLYQENLKLLRRIEDFQAENITLWKLLFETNRRLQLSSAAIKASVSSLLNYDIFWDGTNQHEFLETIDSSINQVGRLINVLTLVFRLKAGTLELRRTYQALQEIISVVQDHFSQRPDSPYLEVSLQTDGRPVLVNYDYLVKSLEFLIEAAAQCGAKMVKIEAHDSREQWIIDISGITESFSQRIQVLLKAQEAPPGTDDLLAADEALRLWLAIHLLLQQGIRIEIAGELIESSHIKLLIPTQTSEKRS